MKIDRTDLELRVLREPYDENKPYKKRKSVVFLIHKPTGAMVRVKHKSQVMAYTLALKELEKLLEKQI